jgi:hypothetical protein
VNDVAKTDRRQATGALKAAADAVPLPSANVPQEQTFWQIVVVGHIDARQHLPQWYRLIDCISDIEMNAAVQSAAVLVMPPTPGLPTQASVQFDAGPFLISCIPDKWAIRTVSEAHCVRMIDVASKVFAKLNEIAVTAYGVNRVFSLSTPGSAKQFLADRVMQANLALTKGDSECNLMYVTHYEESDTLIAVGPSALDVNALQVTYNRNHRITTSSGYFNLGGLLKRDADPDWQAAAEYSSALARAISNVK